MHTALAPRWAVAAPAHGTHLQDSCLARIYDRGSGDINTLEVPFLSFSH